MLGIRTRGRGAHSGKPGAGRPNCILCWGNDKAAKLGGGHYGGNIFYYPQRMVILTDVVDMGSGSASCYAVDGQSRLFGVGGNTEGGAAGQGTHSEQGFFEANEVFDPTRIEGGKGFHQREKQWGNAAPLPAGWWQPQGNVGPYIPTAADVAAGRAAWTIAEVDGAASHGVARTTDGRCLAWGSNTGGAHGNGYEYQLEQGIREQKAGNFAQYEPWWVQTAGPKQSEPGFAPNGRTLVGGVAGAEDAVYSYDLPAYWRLVSGVVGTPTARYVFDPTVNPLGYGSGRGANILTGVRIARAAEAVNFYVKGDEVWYSGSPAGKNTEYHMYAAKDLKWDPTNPAHLPSGFHILDLQCTHGAYVLLIGNGNPAQNELRFVGNNFEYCAGTAVEKSTTTSTREVLIPREKQGGTLLSLPAKGVIAVDKGEYMMKAIKTDGTLWTCGGNVELQQGIPGLGRLGRVPVLTKVEAVALPDGSTESLYAGGRTVLAVSCAGEHPHTPGLGPLSRTVGANGGDSTLIILSDGSMRALGLNWEYNVGAPIRWEGYGILGNGTSENSELFVEPIGKPKNIVAVCAGVQQQMALQEPGVPSAGSLRTRMLDATTLRVEWELPQGLTAWREPDGFRAVVIGIDGAGESLKYESPRMDNTDGEGKEIRHYDFPALARNTTYEVHVAEQTAAEEANIIGGAWHTAVNGSVTLSWNPLERAEPSLITQWRRRGSKAENGAIPASLSTALTVSATGELKLSSGLAEKIPKNQYVLVTSPGGSAFTLQADVGTAVPISSLSVSPLPEALTKGQQVHIGEQLFAVRTNTAAGATTVPVEEITPKVGASKGASCRAEWAYTFQTSAEAKVGATVIKVFTDTPVFAFPVGSSVVRSEKDDWIRNVPELKGDTTTTTFALVQSRLGIPGEDIEAEVEGTFEGLYQTRFRQIYVP